MRRPIEATFLRLEKLIPSREDASIRKQFCLAYLEWKTRGFDSYKRVWVNLAVDFRKIECRVGSKRTKLEKLARRHFRQRRRLIGNSRSREAASTFARKQLEEGTGIHAPERVALRSQIAKENLQRQIAEGRHPRALVWVISTESGEQFRIRNLTQFCREHNINYRNLHFTAVSNWWAKGFRARKFDPVTDEHIPWRDEVR